MTTTSGTTAAGNPRSIDQQDVKQPSHVTPAVDEISLFISCSAVEALQAVYRAGLLPSDLQEEVGNLFSVSAGTEDASLPSPGTSEGEPASSALIVSERAVDDQKVLVSRRCLVDVARWARSDDGTAGLSAAQLVPSEYTLIALQAGSRTVTSAAQDRLISANPDLATPFLPSTSQPFSSNSTNKSRSTSSAQSTQSFSIASIGTDIRNASRELSAVANILFSVGGVGGGVWWVARHSSGMGNEKATLLAFLSAFVVAFAEIWLYISHFTALEKQRRLGEVAFKVNMAKDLTARPKEAVEQASDQDEGNGKVKEDKVLEDAAMGVSGGPEDSKGTARQEPMKLRLRRKPLPEMDKAT